MKLVLDYLKDVVMQKGRVMVQNVKLHKNVQGNDFVQCFKGDFGLPPVDGYMMPRYDPVLEGGELALSCAKMKAIPSPEALDFGKGEILTVKVVEKEAGQATTGW